MYEISHYGYAFVRFLKSMGRYRNYYWFKPTKYERNQTCFI